MDRTFVKKACIVTAKVWPFEGRMYGITPMMGDHSCSQCGEAMHDHGRVNVIGITRLICPGDYVITGPSKQVSHRKRADFLAEYDEIDPEKAFK